MNMQYWSQLADSRLNPSEKVKDEIRVSISNIRKEFPAWEQENDVRWAWFTGAKKVLQVAQTSFIFTRDQLCFPDWWRSKTAEFNENHISGHIKEFFAIILFGTSNITFTITEELFRSLVISIDPDACNSGRANFSSICDYTLNQLDRKQYKRIFTFHRLIRNTIHTNGVYSPPNRQNQTIEYRGKPYLFEDGKLIRFFDFELLLALISDYNTAIYDIVMHNDIKSNDHIPRLHEL
ncbi:MAG: hypothetical protein ABIL58_11525 [Pseudomonadota bacterium]